MPKTIGSVLILGMLQVGLQAQPGADVWARVIALQAGTPMTVTLSSGTIVSGILKEAGDEAVVLTDSTILRGQLAAKSLRDPNTFRRADIVRLQFRGAGAPRTRQQKVLRGVAMAGAAAAGFILIGSMLCCRDD